MTRHTGPTGVGLVKTRPKGERVRGTRAEGAKERELA